eukprot:6468448-Amphidinium_carterae.1
MPPFVSTCPLSWVGRTSCSCARVVLPSLPRASTSEHADMLYACETSTPTYIERDLRRCPGHGHSRLVHLSHAVAVEEAK